jgi:hypothetical protein
VSTVAAPQLKSRFVVSCRFKTVSTTYDRVLVALIAALGSGEWMDFQTIVGRLECQLRDGKPMRERGATLRIRAYEKLVSLMGGGFVERDGSLFKVVDRQLPALEEYVASCRADAAILARTHILP